MPDKNSAVPYQINNPTDDQRHEMLRYTLAEDDRIEDFNNIIELLSPPPSITTISPKNSGKNIRIAVIGAGEAGLSAAFELRKIGCDITIFEAGKRIGGRIYTHYFDNDKRYPAELGAMRVPASHETSWHYINLFKLNTSPFVTQNINGLFYVRNAYAINDPQGISIMRNIYPKFYLTPEERNTPWQQLSGRVLNRYFSPLPPEVRRELIEAKPVYSEAIQRIDMLDYRSAYESVGLSQDAISMIGFLLSFEQTFFKLSLTEMLQEAYTADFAFTYRVNGGMINLPLSFYGALSDQHTCGYEGIDREDLGKVNFKMGFAVDGIYRSPEGQGIILEYRNASSFDIAFEKFDYIVCAIPFSSLRRVRINPLFSVAKNQAIVELNYENSQKTFLFLKDRFWEAGDPYTRIVGGSSTTDLPNIALFYPSDHAMPIPGIANGWTLRPGASPLEPGVMLASYNLSQEAVRLGSEYEALRFFDIKRYVERIHALPWGYLDSKLISYKSILWSEAQYIWSAFCLSKPQDKLLFSYIITQPEMDDRVFFAGEHISQKHAWQQGALQTGMLAANEIAKRIGFRKG